MRPLGKGAYVNAQGITYGHALQAASYKGQEAIVRLLVKKGASIHAHSKKYSGALQAASVGGHKSSCEAAVR